jgi:hypothetical protein
LLLPPAVLLPTTVVGAAGAGRASRRGAVTLGRDRSCGMGR